MKQGLLGQGEVAEGTGGGLRDNGRLGEPLWERGKGRNAKVERVNLKLADEQKEGGEMRNRYVDALEGMKNIVTSKSTNSRKGRNKKSMDVEMAD